ncbi:MAG TPA: ComF family protein [Syntrophorhabdaceae bacterium]|nr:ComF family protein [Syntrophorhabdaceae bacterium]
MHNLLRSVLDIFYPLYCGACNTPGSALCETCIDSFRIVDQKEACPICGRPIGKTILCGACMEQKRTYSHGYFGFYFEDKLRDTIHAFKFRGRRDVGRLLVRLIEAKIRGIAHSFDVIVPIPVTWRRLMERGFNQSFIIGEEIAKITGKSIYPSVLVKTKKTRDQYLLSREERRKNVKGIFSVRNESSIEGKKVLLVDDLFTPGYTAREASRCLIARSAGEVILFALARTPS